MLDGFVRALGSAFVAYARDELRYKTDITYALLAGEVSGKWDWDGETRRSASVSDDLRVLLALGPSFRLLVAHGYSDLVTPYGASRYVLDHLPVGPPDRAKLRVYRGGHMFYFDEGARRAFTAEAKSFYLREP
jgi:carboxypeptidase C (cathepsin A)